MAVLCNVILMPVPSSRGAEKPPDAEFSELVFEAVPAKGDVLTLGDGWPEDLRGRGYMVNGAEWPLEAPEPGRVAAAGKPTVEAIRVS